MKKLNMDFKKWIIIALALFVLGVAIGIFPPSLLTSLITDEINALERLGGSIVPFTLSMFIIVFIRNAIALLAGFVFSPILCLTPILSLVNNGVILSFMGRTIAHEKSFAFALAGILPHGIFEIAAFIIGGAASLSFGIATMQVVFKESKRKQLLPNLKLNSKYLLIALALLLPAAAVETYVTPLLLR